MVILMKITEYIYPEINNQEVEIELRLDIYESGDYEILDVYEEDHDNLTKSDLIEIAHDYIYDEMIIEAVRKEQERKECWKNEQKLEKMRINSVDKY